MTAAAKKATVEASSMLSVTFTVVVNNRAVMRTIHTSGTSRMRNTACRKGLLEIASATGGLH